MTHNDFTSKELLQFGWNKTKQYFWFLFIVSIIYIALQALTSHIPVVGTLVSMGLSIAVLALTLSITAGHAPNYEQLIRPFQTYKIALQYLVGSILYMFAVAIGIILIILPGIYLAVRLQFYSYFIVEHEGMNAIDALKKSMAITEGKFWHLFGFMLLIILVNILGALALGIGLFFTLPMSSIAYTLLYKKLTGGHAGHIHAA